MPRGSTVVCNNLGRYPPKFLFRIVATQNTSEVDASSSVNAGKMI
mgnify:FL=1